MTLFKILNHGELSERIFCILKKKYCSCAKCLELLVIIILKYFELALVFSLQCGLFLDDKLVQFTYDN